MQDPAEIPADSEEGDIMRNLKKFTALALTAAVVLSMSACGSKEGADSSDTENKISITSAEDLADLKIGVQTGTTGDLQATDIVKDDTQMNRFNTGADAVQALKNGKVDCVVIDSQPAAKFVELNDDL